MLVLAKKLVSMGKEYTLRKKPGILMIMLILPIILLNKCYTVSLL